MASKHGAFGPIFALRLFCADSQDLYTDNIKEFQPLVRDKRYF